MKPLLLAAIPFALHLSVGDARACGIHPPPQAVFHSALPRPLPAGVIIAEVEAEPDEGGATYPYGMRVRVRRMIQGGAAPALLLRTGRTSTCFDAFGNGRSGYVVGVLAGASEGMPIVDPIRVFRQDGYRLPDGWQLPPPSNHSPSPPAGNTVVIDR